MTNSGYDESVMIQSDGTPMGTKITTADGSKVGRVKSMDIAFRVDEFVSVNIEIIAPVISTKASATYEWLWLQEYSIGQLESLKKEIDNRIGDINDK
jgi:hypothetical protein